MLIFDLILVTHLHWKIFLYEDLSTIKKFDQAYTRAYKVLEAKVEETVHQKHKEMDLQLSASNPFKNLTNEELKEKLVLYRNVYLARHGAQSKIEDDAHSILTTISDIQRTMLRKQSEENQSQYTHESTLKETINDSNSGKNNINTSDEVDNQGKNLNDKDKLDVTEKEQNSNNDQDQIENKRAEFDNQNESETTDNNKDQTSSVGNEQQEHIDHKDELSNKSSDDSFSCFPIVRKKKICS